MKTEEIFSHISCRSSAECLVSRRLSFLLTDTIRLTEQITWITELTEKRPTRRTIQPLHVTTVRTQNKPDSSITQRNANPFFVHVVTPVSTIATAPTSYPSEVFQSLQLPRCACTQSGTDTFNSETIASMPSLSARQIFHTRARQISASAATENEWQRETDKLLRETGKGADRDLAHALSGSCLQDIKEKWAFVVCTTAGYLPIGLRDKT